MKQKIQDLPVARAAAAEPRNIKIAAPDMILPLRHPRYQLHTSLPPNPFPYYFEPFIFLTPAYVGLQTCQQRFDFYLLDVKLKRVVALMQLFIDGEKAVSPCRAPFGAVQLGEGLPASVLYNFLALVRGFAEKKGLKEIHIKSYPFAYAPQQSALLTNTLLQLGFVVALSEVNHHIPVSETAFEARIYPAAARRLAKCRRSGFAFQQEEARFLPEIYNFIAACRREKNQDLSLQLPALQAFFNRFPENYHIFTVRDGAGKLAAATVAVRINSEILYNFYPASPLAYNLFSPVIMLNAGLYDYCRSHGYKMLDLGTSSLPEGPNYSLMKFKKHIGGEVSLKLHFSCTF